MSAISLEKVKSDAEVFAIEKVQEHQTASVISEVHLAFGAIGGMRIVSKFIGAATIKVLQNIRDEEKYKSFGYSRFDHFLDNDKTAQQYVGISYRSFNYLEKQMLNEGDEIYDLLNHFRIPISTRQLLSDGEIKIEVEGDQLQIGEEIINLAEKPDIKGIFKDLAKDVKKLTEAKNKSEAKLEELEETIKAGVAENEELRRSIDAQSETSPYERALARAISSLINLKNEAEKLPLVETQTRGKFDLETLWNQMVTIRKALQQDDVALIEDVAFNDAPSRAMEAFANDDDFGDDD